MKSIRLLCALTLGLLASCGGGSGGGSPSSSFNLLFAAPAGSGGGAVELGKLRYSTKGPGDVVLAPGVAVTGLVRDGAGGPLTAVPVTFTGRTGSAAATAITNGSGIYTVNLSEGNWTAAIDSLSAGTGTLTVPDIAVDATPLTRNFQFPVGVVASGIVFDSGSNGIDGALLDFTGLTTGATVSVMADGFGFYSATLPPDTYEVVVDPGVNGPTQLKERFEDVQVAAAGTIHFGLTEGVQLSGVLLNDIGGPLTEAVDIDVLVPEGSEFFAPATATASAVDGSYSIGPVPAGSTELLFTPPADSGYPRQELTLAVTGPATQTSDLMLASGVLVTGTVLWDDALTAAAGATIQALTTAKNTLAPEPAVTDGAGFFQLSLFPGDWELRISPVDPMDLQLPEAVAVTVPNGGAIAVNRTLTAGVLISGNVSDLNASQPDIRVEIPGVIGAVDISDGAGDYSFLAPAGTYDLLLTGVAGAYRYIALDPLAGVVIAGPGPVSQDIALTRATTGRTVLQGTVFEPDGVTAAIGAEITARDNKSGAILARTQTDGAGLYQLVLPE